MHIAPDGSAAFGSGVGVGVGVGVGDGGVYGAAAMAALPMPPVTAMRRVERTTSYRWVLICRQ
jgi:hypothetical protein